LVTPRDGRDGSGGGDRHEQRIAQADALDALAKEIPTRAVRRRDTPGVELQFTARGSRVFERRVLAASFRQVRGRRECRVVDLFENLAIDGACLLRVERNTQLKEHVL